MQSSIVEVVESNLDDSAWFQFEDTQDLQTQGEYPGVRFVFRTGVGDKPADCKIAQIVNFDIGVGDFVLPVELELRPILDEKSISWSVYPREMIVSEKLHSFLSRPLGNSRAKDLFDLKFYLPDCDPKLLREAVNGTYSARGDTFCRWRRATFQFLDKRNTSNKFELLKNFFVHKPLESLIKKCWGVPDGRAREGPLTEKDEILCVRIPLPLR